MLAKKWSTGNTIWIYISLSLYVSKIRLIWTKYQYYQSWRVKIYEGLTTVAKIQLKKVSFSAL